MPDDPGARLLTLLSEMDDGETLNLWRRFRDARAQNKEGAFVQEVTMFTSQDDDEAKTKLAWLDGLSDDAFDQALAMLAADVRSERKESERQDRKASRDEILGNADAFAGELADKLKAWRLEHTDEKGRLRFGKKRGR